MAKKKAKAQEEESLGPVMTDPFVGGEDDDLLDMEYIQDEDSTTKVETHPPETKEEAELLEEPEAEAEAEEEAPEAEAEEEAPEAEAPAEDGEHLKVPKDRFDEVNERMKKAEARQAELERKLEGITKEPAPAPEPEPEPYDYAAKEKAAMDALLEGDQDAYAALRAEIRTAEKEETLREARAIAETGDAQSREALSFEEAGAQIEASMPQLSIESENYNSDAREEMLDLFVGYAQSGNYTRVEALQRSADKIARMYGFDVESATPPDNVVDLKPTNIKNKVQIASNQPPNMKGKAAGEAEQSNSRVMTMSDEEFDALPESAKRRMRGDIL